MIFGRQGHSFADHQKLGALNLRDLVLFPWCLADRDTGVKLSETFPMGAGPFA